ncbi:hypothetical protein F4775DRAFT_599615 [Biscogniauxia sp. FL1348]|nr:hypothetical protein F4775DRAFT_599615 [Biscogniauxia sp. FL1348]
MEKHHPLHEEVEAELGHDDEKRLAFFVSPVLPDDKIRTLSFPAEEVDELQDIEALGSRYNVKQIPYFEKHSSSTNIELFYDLWFVANLSTFTAVHEVTETTKLWSYVGFISILWFNWFLVGLFDVRFVTDSVFERLAHTVHLGVMVGFSVVASHFDPDEQIKETFQAMCKGSLGLSPTGRNTMMKSLTAFWFAALILMVSRLVLTIEYSTIIWHVRHFKEGKIPLAVVTGFHFIAALIYMGISFRFEDGKNSRVFVAWYVIAAVEVVLQLSVSHFSQVLSFNGTHLTERMTLLTLIILGEGVVGIAENVVTIVKNNGWTSATIGVLTAGVATIYIVFMIYFDWMVLHHRLTGLRQIAWSILHFPFHVLLLIFTEGATQFLQWWKLLEVTTFANDQFYNSITDLDSYNGGHPTQALVDSLNKTCEYIFSMYPPTYTITYEEVDRVLSNFSSVPDNYWYSNTHNQTTDDMIYENLRDLVTTMANSLYANFDIDPIEEMEDITDPTEAQYTAMEETQVRYILVFQYTFSAAGLCLILMTALYLLTKTRRSFWTPFNSARAALFFLIGLGLALLDLLSTDAARRQAFLHSPWLLPTLCLVFFLVLALTHVPRPPPLFFLRRGRGRKEGDGAYAHVAQGQPEEEEPQYNMYADGRATGARPAQIWGGSAYAAPYDGQGPDLGAMYPTYSPDQAYHNMYGQAGEHAGVESFGLKRQSSVKGGQGGERWG